MLPLVLLAIFTPEPDVKNSALRKELLARVETDQAARTKLIDAGTAPPADLVKAVGDADDTNRTWLKDVIEKYGWPGKSLVGEDGAHAAWLLVQHADADIKFQKECLKHLEIAVTKGEAAGTDLAYLTDRVLAAEGKNQRYGTQLEQKDGKLVARAVDEPDTLDARRKAIGMMPMAEYVVFAEKMYKLRPTIPERNAEIEAIIVKVVPGKAGDKMVLAILFLKGRDEGLPIRKTTVVHKQAGKLVPAARLEDLKVDVKIRVWLLDDKAESVLILP
jgi:hypothetical protein